MSGLISGRKQVLSSKNIILHLNQDAGVRKGEVMTQDEGPLWLMAESATTTLGGRPAAKANGAQ